MSYDLSVFDSAAAPRDRTKFLAWFEKQCEWEESHGYNDPDIASPALKEWFREIIKTYPPMNGPLASDDPDDPKVTDYSLGCSMIYGAFAWSEAPHVYKHVRELAAKHGVGFFDVSGDDGDIWWPVPDWKLACEARGDIPLPLDLAFGDVLSKLDPKKNSFFVLEHDNGNYMQCGGSKSACTVEFRVYDGPKNYRHYIVGHAGGSTATAFRSAKFSLPSRLRSCSNTFLRAKPSRSSMHFGRRTFDAVAASANAGRRNPIRAAPHPTAAAEPTNQCTRIPGLAPSSGLRR